MKNLSLTFCLLISAFFGSVGSGFALPKCKGSPTKNFSVVESWTDCKGTVSRGGFKYVGEFRFGKPDGNGTATQPNGDVYVGQWVHNRRKHGKGTFNFANGDKYIGEIRDNYFSGQGILNYANGDKYVGEFKEGIRNGQGTHTFANGDKYVGEWKNDKQNGRGIKTWGRYSDWAGDKYVGDFRNGRRTGLGVYYSANGEIHEGIWEKEKFLKSKKTHYSDRAQKIQKTLPDLLRIAFKKLTEKQRKKLQTNLKDLGFYKSSIDGLYGKGTAGALTGYNKQNLNGADLKKSKNVEKLFNVVLGLKTSPKPKIETAPIPVAKTPPQKDETYKVASGSGFYVSNEGHIITNHHVIEGCKDIKVHSKGSVLKTKRIAEDRRNDLALLKTIESPKHSFALSSESPFPLQDIVVAGYPFGEKVSSTLKFTQGIVSSIAGLGNDYSQIQIDAAIQPGNSGGPILDEYGNVVAVAVAKLSLKKILKDFGVVPENTNFGVKASAVRNLMEGNGVSFKSPNTEVISKRELSQVATDGTVYLTCWMTTAQIEQMRARKVLFEDLE